MTFPDFVGLAIADFHDHFRTFVGLMYSILTSMTFPDFVGLVIADFNDFPGLCRTGYCCLLGLFRTLSGWLLLTSMTFPDFVGLVVAFPGWRGPCGVNDDADMAVRLRWG